MKAFKRSKRVADQIVRDASEIVATMLGEERVVVTVTGAEVTDDLRHAKVYYTVLGDEEKKKWVEDYFQRKTGVIQNRLSHRLRLRRFPEIVMVFDTSLDAGLRLTSLIDRVIADQEQAKGATGGDA